MNDMNREMRRMAEREERLAKKADRNIGQKNTDEKVSRIRRVFNYLSEVTILSLIHISEPTRPY